MTNVHTAKGGSKQGVSKEERALLHLQPRSLRPAHGSVFLAILFFISFNLGIVVTNVVQILALPLLLIPGGKGEETFERIVTFTKGAFGKLTVLIAQWFAPTKFVITAGHGVKTGQSETWVVRDKDGKVTHLRLPSKGVWVSNHQTLCDWLYIWSFTYLTSHHDSLLITLKASIQMIPIVGWACQLFGFIFLARNWAMDKISFKRQLEKVAKRVQTKENGVEEKMALLIFPEGTLVTGNTRPISKKFADKLGVPDLKHTLLPRSTGLFFALRTLARAIPDLALIDLTVGYPGPVAPYWPEDYYNLSIYFNQLPPPQIHIHLRVFDVRKEIPLGDLGSGKGDDEGTEEEKRVFDEWLRELWTEKDALMANFVENGSFDAGERTENGQDSTAQVPNTNQIVEWPLELRHWRESLEAFSYFIPFPILYYMVPFVWSFFAAVAHRIINTTPRESATVEPVLRACGCGKKAAGQVLGAVAEIGESLRSDL